MGLGKSMTSEATKLHVKILILSEERELSRSPTLSGGTTRHFRNQEKGRIFLSRWPTRLWARDFSVTTFTAEEGRVVTKTQPSPLRKG
jgi:hypothetical protein